MAKILLLTHLLFTANTNSLWEQPNTLFPLTTRTFGVAVASYNHSIYLLSTSQLIEYDINNALFIDHGTEYLGRNVNMWGIAQYYTQMDHILYSVSIESSNKESALSTFDMQTLAFNPSYHITPAFIESGSACLASSNGHIFVVAGGDPTTVLNTLQVLQLSSGEWLSNTPSLLTPRQEHACIIDPATNVLYAIAGYNGYDTYISTIEQIQTLNIINNAWSLTGYLIQALAYTRAVIYRDAILIIGGADWFNEQYRYFDIIQELDPATNTISIFSDSLPYALSDMAAINVANEIYLFGGDSSSSDARKWVKYYVNLSSSLSPISSSPTLMPTIVESTAYISTNLITTYSPTPLEPTAVPTIIPSVEPTIVPMSTTAFRHQTTYVSNALSTTNEVDLASTTTAVNYQMTNVSDATHTTDTSDILSSTNKIDLSSTTSNVEHDNSDVYYTPKKFDYTLPVIASVVTAVVIACFGLVCVYLLHKEDEREKHEEEMQNVAALQKASVQQHNILAQRMDQKIQNNEEARTIEGPNNAAPIIKAQNNELRTIEGQNNAAPTIEGHNDRNQSYQTFSTYGLTDAGHI